ncbi:MULTISPECIES: hypothetical protein [unclassified Aliivibrio]|uniref:hypothetical protein n=1 Tax=unclassified Aliivibrio TaxID=2645654 RepID=UPI00080DDBE2|nr:MULTISPECIES: hypothetical protein [unclassified Aliivibrio]OCH13097.1 hypothetical protein A6E05_08115 [Aliivibrio sp. 1S165]OCH25108.1 hypothetical protein A6E03_04915 [Aliivibrio sp. 1S128]OCH28213.1 hypothetical protein A6E06_07320 [Aliivibrio sp. 1S175]
MKKVLFTSVMMMALSGCQMTSESTVDWQQDNKVEIMNTQIQLSSAVWIDQMPTIGSEEDESKFNVALTLSSKQVIAPELTIEKVVMRQGEESWVLTDDEFEVRVHDNHTWEIAGQSFHTLDSAKLLDIAVQVNDEWIIENNIQIDTVY